MIQCRKCLGKLEAKDYNVDEKAFFCSKCKFYSGYGKMNIPFVRKERD